MSTAPSMAPVAPGDRARRVPLASLGALALMLIAAAGAADAAARPVAQSLDRSRLGRAPVAIHDRVISRPSPGLRTPEPHAPTGGLEGRYPVGDGHTVRVILSAAYEPEPKVAQSVATFLGTLVHGGEIDGVTVFLGTQQEIGLVCGEGAEACFNSTTNLMLVPATPPPNGIPQEDVVAHEYGHAVANGRSNFPFPAVGTGTKRWATYEHVCQQIFGALTHPDRGISYRDDPGEAFADSYRILNGGDPGLFIFNRSFFPNPTDLGLIRQDVLDPWGPRLPDVRTGAFPADRPGVATARFSIATPLDGVLKVNIEAPPGADDDLELNVAGVSHAVARGAKRGRFDQVSALICGTRSFVVNVRRHSGSGRFRLTVSRP